MTASNPRKAEADALYRKKKYGEAPPGWDVDVPAASSGAEAQGATAAKPAPSEAVETL